MGLSLRLQGDIEKAIESYQSSLAINPNSEMTLVNLGNLIAEQGHLDEAEKFFQRALQINPNNFKTNKTFVFSMLYNPNITTGYFCRTSSDCEKIGGTVIGLYSALWQ